MLQPFANTTTVESALWTPYLCGHPPVPPLWTLFQEPDQLSLYSHIQQVSLVWTVITLPMWFSVLKANSKQKMRTGEGGPSEKYVRGMFLKVLKKQSLVWYLHGFFGIPSLKK